MPWVAIPARRFATSWRRSILDSIDRTLVGPAGRRQTNRREPWQRSANDEGTHLCQNPRPAAVNRARGIESVGTNRPAYVLAVERGRKSQTHNDGSDNMRNRPTHKVMRKTPDRAWMNPECRHKLAAECGFREEGHAARPPPPPAPSPPSARAVRAGGGQPSPGVLIRAPDPTRHHRVERLYHLRARLSRTPRGVGPRLLAQLHAPAR